MMYRVNIAEAELLSRLFSETDDTAVTAFLSGRFGAAFANGTPARSAMIKTGDFTFPAGVPDRELFRMLDGLKFALIVPETEGWCRAIEEEFGEQTYSFERFAFEKTADFDIARLTELAALPEGCEYRRIDGELFSSLSNEDWSSDFTGVYPNYEDYAKHGLGVVALKDGAPVSGASSYYDYIKNGARGIEIEVDTREDQRGRGLATACSARLILDALERGIYPTWDAANETSRHIAGKLGFRYRGTYITYVLRRR